MPPTIVTYFTYSEIAGTQKPTIDEFRAQLRGFNRNETIYVCAVLNALLKNWVGKFDDDAHKRLIEDSLPKNIVDFVLPRCLRHDRGLYHRQQLLFTAKAAARVCLDSGRSPMSLPHWGGLGVVLLMANDLLPKNTSTAAPVANQVINVLSEMIPITEASGFYQPINKMIRSFAMINDFIDNTEIDVQQEFRAATGMTIDQYQALTFAAVTRYADFSFKKYQHAPNDFVLSNHWFRTLKMDEVVIAKFLEDVSATSGEYAASLIKRDGGPNDYTVFRDRPLMRDGEAHILIDAAFLAEKTESSPFWRVLAVLAEEKKKRFHAIWGSAFEKYVNHLLRESVDNEKNKLIPNPVFADNEDEVCDAIVLCDDAALFIETKASMFTAEGKYGLNPAKLKDEIDQKLAGKKGVGQLAKHIEEAFSRRSPRAIRGLENARISKVYPVLVTRDDIGAALVMNRYLAEKFKEQFQRKSVSIKVTPIFSLSAQDIENICAYLSDVSFAEMLDARYENDPTLLSTFWALPNAAVERFGLKKPDVMHKLFKRFSKMVNGELQMKTPEESSSPD